MNQELQQIQISIFYFISFEYFIFYKLRLIIGLMSYCEPTYYGNQCSVRCIPNDDCTSSYTCNPLTGAMMCSPGWYGTGCTIRNTSYIQPTCSSTGKIKNKELKFEI
jgi:hypothetical protein